MLHAFRSNTLRASLVANTRLFARMESNGLGWEDIKTIRANTWPVLKGEADAEKSKLAKSNYLKKRVTNNVPK